MKWPATALTEKMGIQLPIIQAPMAGGITTAELVAAVSNAGGLGSLGAGYMTPAEIKQGIKKIRQLTHKPFAVNLFIPEPVHATAEQIQNACDAVNQSCMELDMTVQPVVAPYAQSFEEQLQVIIEDKVPVFSYTFGTLDSAWTAALQKNHTLLIGTATNLAEAYALEAQGADVIVAQGSEAGGHRGTFIGEAENALIGLVSLIPQLVDHIKLPIIAAGGIMDGRGIKAAMNIGAAGVQMGTAFLSCSEANIPSSYKEILLTQHGDNTVLTRAFSGKLARGIRNKFIERLENKPHDILNYPIQNALTNTLRKKAKEENNADFMSLWAGQSAFLCRALTAKQLITALVAEMNER